MHCSEHPLRSIDDEYASSGDEYDGYGYDLYRNAMGASSDGWWDETPYESDWDTE